MTSLQGPGRQNSPDDFADLVQRLVSLRRDLNDVSASVLKSAGIRVSPDGMSIERALEVLGALNVSGDLDVSGNATFSGDTTIGGNAAITGTLSLPAGIIDNEALANPVEAAGTSAIAEGYSLTTTQAVIASTTLVVPAGYTRCVATGIGSIFALNPTTSVDYLYARVYIEAPGQSWWGVRPLSMMGPSNGSAALAPVRMVELSGLEGGQVITFSLRAYTAFQAMSSTSNLGGISAQAIFLR